MHDGTCHHPNIRILSSAPCSQDQNHKSDQEFIWKRIGPTPRSEQSWTSGKFGFGSGFELCYLGCLYAIGMELCFYVSSERCCRQPHGVPDIGHPTLSHLWHKGNITSRTLSHTFCSFWVLSSSDVTVNRIEYGVDRGVLGYNHVPPMRLIVVFLSHCHTLASPENVQYSSLGKASYWVSPSFDQL